MTPRGPGPLAKDVEPADGDRPSGQDHVLARTHPRIRSLPVHLDRADRAGHLGDLTGETGDGMLNGLGAQTGDIMGRDDLTVCVVGNRGLTKTDRPGVRLVTPDEERQKLGGAIDAQDEDTGGHRVQRPSMADPAGTTEPSTAGDDVVAGPSGRLVDDEQPVRSGHRLWRLRPWRLLPTSCTGPR